MDEAGSKQTGRNGWNGMWGRDETASADSSTEAETGQGKRRGRGNNKKRDDFAFDRKQRKKKWGERFAANAYEPQRSSKKREMERWRERETENHKKTRPNECI